ncbi:hypothetical protein [Lysinibacter cavernae]|uniref:Uncharacterized protein n=1 Tax=Lysinibacter cavernae TaxID=1640652 RepID=A0A7X5TTD6_9MICO|nr:hypothetical protein [Lysinibacter cavernae]NIH53379.1 hypothetical protein [Lysinibacter cavernae]
MHFSHVAAGGVCQVTPQHRTTELTVSRLRFERTTQDRIETTLKVLLGQLTDEEAALRLSVPLDDIVMWVNRLQRMPEGLFR